MMIKSIAEIFESLDEKSYEEEGVESTELIKPEVIGSPGSELAGMSTIERGEFCFDLRVKGFRVKHIATKYEVDQSTVYRWIKSYLDQFGRDFESQTKADILMQELVFLEHLQEVGLYEMRQAEYDAVEMIEGKIVKTRSAEAKMIKIQFLKLVLQIRKMRQDLLITAGIIPKQPERIYHTMADEKKTVDSGHSDGSEKTPEQYKESIANLLRETRTLPR